MSAENSRRITDHEHQEMISKLRKFNEGVEKPNSQKERRWAKNYTLVELSGVYTLVRGEGQREVVPDSQLFDILHEMHLTMLHPGRDKMMVAVKKYWNVTQEMVEIYLATCEGCEEKRRRPKKSLVIKPIMSEDLNSRAQVDLINFESAKDGHHKYILTYQDHLTKFVRLRPLKSKRAAEVSYNILDIFCEVGAPLILQSDNGTEFVNEVINELKLMWPGLQIVHGSPRHSQSQGSVERANRTVQEKLACWQAENPGIGWTQGLRFVQWEINAQVHSGTGKSPYEATYGCPPRLGLGTTRLPPSVAKALQSEEELRNALSGSFAEDADAAGDGTEVDAPGDTEPSAGGTDTPMSSNVSEAGPSRERNETAVANRLCAKRSLAQQASRMLSRSKQKMSDLSAGDNVRVGIPDLDRARGYPRNMLGVVMEKRGEVYRVGTRHGPLEAFFSRNQLDLAKSRILSQEEVPAVKPLSVREAARLASGGQGQGFLKCHCRVRCAGKCTCIKLKLKCSSHCHGSRRCNNKDDE